MQNSIDTLKLLMIIPPMQVVHYGDQDFPPGHYFYNSTTFIFSQKSESFTLENADQEEYTYKKTGGGPNE
ncbi:hypothetical protein AB685_00560 [Bacillus sp. LL01]|nr:hypothetical protein AB685_00560 [Bacillus sp. LL01]